MENELIRKFFSITSGRATLYPTHISMYAALLNCWNQNQQQNPVSISRRKIMRLSRIKSIVTYHKCIRELIEMGLIDYSPSYNKYRGTLINLK